MAGWAAAGRKTRVAGVGGVAALGACFLLSACSPAQVGAAAIVGNQRITQSTLDTQISNYQAAAATYPAGQVTVPSSDVPQAVLSGLIDFAIEDRVAAQAGITVSQSLVQEVTASIESQYAQQYGSANIGLLNSGLPPQLLGDLGKYEAQVYEFQVKANGGKAPTGTPSSAVTAATTKAMCTAAKSLNVQVNPQYGRYDYSQYEVVAGPQTLSRTSGIPTPASTSGLTPAC